MNTIKAVVAYHSGYGHTKKQAEAVAAGIAGVALAEVQLINVATFDDAVWAALQAADAIVFGSPTYMGGVSAEFKTFADASSKVWFTKGWKNKIAGGFTNSASMNGDKGSTIQYLITFAMQHDMIWVGTGQVPAATGAAQRNDVNYLGGSSGALAQSPSDLGPDAGPLPGDLETARLYGERIALITKQFNGVA
ncbi:MAG: flavodoxin family protein [Gammaproteobacteria bacterium]|jgi:NAD(P)H dehydrogenase (quinone)|nr:flavodoxin family protein [Gammaproteobacteria bacterium]